MGKKLNIFYKITNSYKWFFHNLHIYLLYVFKKKKLYIYDTFSSYLNKSAIYIKRLV